MRRPTIRIGRAREWEAQMFKKRILLAIGVVAVAAAASASSAMAESRTGGEWYVGGKTLPIGASKSVKCEVGEHEKEKKLTLTGELGESPKIQVKLTATGVECVEWSISNVETGTTPPV